MGEEAIPRTDVKVLLEMAIHELCIAQERVTKIHHEIQEEIHPRILNALSSLDEIMAIEAIEMTEETHLTFLQTCQRAKELQEGVQLLSTEDTPQPTFQTKGKAQLSSESSETEEDDFTVIVPKVYKPLQGPAITQALTMEQYVSYTNWVYSAQSTNSQIIDTSGIYPRIHFLAGSNTDDVTKAVIHGYCGSITCTPGNREILGMHKAVIEAAKKFRKSSKSDMVVLKLLSASPEVYPTPVPGWIIIQLCTPNKANLKFRKNKTLEIPEVNEGWICSRRATGFTVLLKKLQHIRETNKGFLYNSPSNIYIFAEGNCTPRYDAINKISAGISLITSCRIPGSHHTRVHLCGLIHQEKTAGCCICPLRML